MNSDSNNIIEEIPDEIYVLLLRHQDGDLTLEHITQLESWLAESTQHQAAAQEWLRQQQLLAASHSQAKDYAKRSINISRSKRSSQRHQAQEKIKQYIRRRAKRQAIPLRRNAFLAIAAALLLSLCALYATSLSREPVAQQIGTLHIHGHAPRSVHERQSISLEESKPAILKLNDGTEIRITEAARFTGHALPLTGIAITQGHYEVQAAKQHAGHQLLLTTPHGQVTVLGTRYICAVSKINTSVLVSEGSVRVENKTGDARTLSMHQMCSWGLQRSLNDNPQQTQEAHRVGHWPLDDSSSPYAQDISNWGNHLRFSHDMTAKHQSTNDELDFDTIHTASSKRASEKLKAKSITVAAWIKTTQSTEPGWVLAQGDNYGLAVNRYNNDNDIFFYIHSDSGSKSEWHSVSSGNVQITDGTWQHIAASYDHLTGLATVYKNGKAVASEKISSQIAYTLGDGFSIGNMQGERHFNGQIKDVRVYEKALSASALSKLCAPEAIKP